MTPILRRMQEPSTLGGLAVLALFARARWPEWGAALDAVAAVLGGGAVVLPERGIR